MFRRCRPKVPKLARKNDVRRLVAALDYRDHVLDREGRLYDLGVPVRRDAALALVSVGDNADEDPIPALIKSLGDGAGEVRRAAAAALGARRDPAAVLPLTKAVLTWEEPRYAPARRGAAEALVAFSDPDAIEVVVNEVVERPFDLERAQELVERMADRGGVESARRACSVAAEALSGGRPDVAKRASEVLVWLGTDSLEPLLRALAAPGDGRIEAISALGRIGDLRAGEPLTRCMFDGDAEVRAAVATALGQIAAPMAVQPLVTATGDPDQAVRGAALEALRRLAPLAAIPHPELHEGAPARQVRPDDVGIRRRSRASWLRG